MQAAPENSEKKTWREFFERRYDFIGPTRPNPRAPSSSAGPAGFQAASHTLARIAAARAALHSLCAAPRPSFHPCCYLTGVRNFCASVRFFWRAGTHFSCRYAGRQGTHGAHGANGANDGDNACAPAWRPPPSQMPARTPPLSSRSPLLRRGLDDDDDDDK